MPEAARIGRRGARPSVVNFNQAPPPMIRAMRDVLSFLWHERFWWLSSFLLVMSVLITLLTIGPPLIETTGVPNPPR